ncbi:DUF2809 domain-containing protein [Nonomuraea sp. NN258]|uniref:DUF2809 domain-containing protein n=1 Tax=Nonomuraea antri TaxID=2730852 RepID=UPI0015689053|nr:DUF2809 domain-containing protein [Nonomuraea antri]NRQ34846.1 DUF2809 domain-containing protein [Nonomuraea antri]
MIRFVLIAEFGEDVNLMRRAMVLLGGVALTVGAFTLCYRGPGEPFIRGYVSDVGATMLVYAFLGLLWRTTAARRALATAVIAAAVEFYQIVGINPPGIGGVLVGAFPDPWDLVAYAIGVVVALAWERRSVRSGEQTGGPSDAIPPAH